MDKHPASDSLLYSLEHFEVGIVQLDPELRVVAMNEFALQTLPVEHRQPFGKLVTAFHSDHARRKIDFMFDHGHGPGANPPPMAMIVDIPERVLLSRISKLVDSQGAGTGYVFVFHDVTEVVSAEANRHVHEGKRKLLKIPTVKQHRIVLVDVQAVSYIRSEGHYTWVCTAQGSHFCNLAIGDLEERLDPDTFLRVHRSYIANLARASQILKDEGRVILKLQDDEGTAIPVSRASFPRLMGRLGLKEPFQIE